MLALIKLKIIIIKQQDVIKKKKIYAYITLKYANCSRTHVANSPCYALRYRSYIKARKEKKTKKKEKKKYRQRT